MEQYSAFKQYVAFTQKNLHFPENISCNVIYNCCFAVQAGVQRKMPEFTIGNIFLNSEFLRLLRGVLSSDFGSPENVIDFNVAL